MICSTNSVVSLTNCRFESNQGGINNTGGANLTLNGCTFIDDATPVTGRSGTAVPPTASFSGADTLACLVAP